VTAMRPVSSGFADVNGIRRYHEVHGAGEPLVLRHGGLMTIPEMAPLIQALAAERRVIAVELQGHGRTADTDRLHDRAGAWPEHREVPGRSADETAGR
jgi:pimeloyl-ACP methyl ester carboxylesterase